MKTCTHIHRELIPTAGETRHFIVRFPADVQKVVGFKVTATPKPGDEEHHHEIGNLRLSRDGFLLCDVQVRFEGFEAPAFFNSFLAAVEINARTAVSGAKNEWLAMEIPKESAVVFCKYENSLKFANYTLALYFSYEPKQ